MPNTTENNTALVTVRAARADDPRLSRAVAYTAIADDFIVEDEELFELAAGEVAELARVHAAIDAQRTSITEPLTLALRNANAIYQPVLRKIEEAKKLLGQRMNEFRERERQRIARENAERERVATIEREKIAAQARAAQAEGRDEDAFAIRQTAALVSAAVRPTAPRSVAGVSTRSNWSAECLDIAALIRFVADNPGYTNLLQANPIALKALARAHKDALKVPGVRFFNAGGVAVRRS
jgi:NADH dehydrogenase/NADH:ubiquinone oxidoreductase subunit G